MMHSGNATEVATMTGRQVQHDLHTEIDIDASPETVWGILTDLGSYSDWNPFIVSSEGTVAVGERLTNRMQPPGGKGTTFKPTVTAVEPNATFGFEAGAIGLVIGGLINKADAQFPRDRRQTLSGFKRVVPAFHGAGPGNQGQRQIIADS